jgi:peptidoglycan glycosyltransferase
MNIGSSIRRLTRLFIILFLALSGGLVYWQVVVAQQVTSNIHNGRHCLADSAPLRGRILDRNGVVLAESKPDPTGICGYRRYYYLDKYPSLASLLGYYISPNFGSSGIEKQYDDYLSGRRGITVLNNTVNQTLHRPSVGDDIYLTIDTRMQQKLDYNFDHQAYNPDQFFVYKTDRGSAIVSNPHTGEILAMLSRPTFDPNRIFQEASQGNYTYFNSLEKNPEQPLLERPLQSTFVPGSIYKTVTLLAALDSGKAHLDDPFYNDKNPNHMQALGPVVLGTGDQTETFGPKGNNIDTYTNHYPVNLRYGFTHSDNIIFAQVGAHTGADTWLEYNKRFYVGQQIPFDLPVKISTVAPANGKPLGTNQLGENAFGQGINLVTPLQMTMFDNAIANNGTLMRPTLIQKIVDPNGATVYSSSPQSLGTPISDTTASQVRDAMYGVVQCGSGKFGPSAYYDPQLYQSPWHIIAKTGTGQAAAPGVGAQAWLLTQAPYENPQLTIVAMKENGGEAAPAVGPMVTHTYDDIFRQYMKTPTSPATDPNFCATTGLLQG